MVVGVLGHSYVARHSYSLTPLTLLSFVCKRAANNETSFSCARPATAARRVYKQTLWRRFGFCLHSPSNLRLNFPLFFLSFFFPVHSALLFWPRLSLNFGRTLGNNNLGAFRLAVAGSCAGADWGKVVRVNQEGKNGCNMNSKYGYDNGLQMPSRLCSGRGT